MNQKQAIEAELSAAAGVAVEVTIRGPRAFTWSTASVDYAAADRLVRFAKRGLVKSIEVVHEPELGSFVYVEA